MANEATLIQQLEDRQLELTVAVSGTFLKGSVLGLSGAQVGSNVNTLWHKFGGIATADKIVDNVSKMAVWTKGVFEMTLSGTTDTEAGTLVGISNVKNVVAVIPSAVAASGGFVIGKAMTIATGGDKVQVMVGEF